jgi:trehalose 6-phosphate phosphatase
VVEAGALESGDAIRAISDEHAAAIDAAGIRVEDKHPITALHWRGAADERRAAAAAREVAEAALAAGVAVKPGRKVLELRPASASDKGAAVARLIAESGVERVLYAGDDSTDVDAFRALGRMRVNRELRRVVRIAVASAEEPADLRSRADVVVSGPDEIAELIAMLGEDRHGD